MESPGDPGRGIDYGRKGDPVKLRMEAVLPKDLVVDIKKMDRVVNNAMDGAALGAKVDFDVTTRTFRRRPAFLIKTPKYGVRDVYTIDEIYSYLDDGTRAHVIRARRRGGRLAFYRSGFRAKTRVRYIGSNKGRSANKDFSRPESVMHPGFPAREFSIEIQKKWQKMLNKILQRAIDAEIK